MSDKRPILTYEAQINRVLPGLIPEIREQVLADAKARIEDLHYGDDNLLIGTGYQLAVNDALAALTQPQTERCPEDCDGFGRLIGDSDGPCPACSGLESDGGGAATEKCPNPDCEGGTRPNGEGGWDMCPDCLEAANADGGGAAAEKCPRCSGYGTLTAGDDCELCAGSGSVPQTEGEDKAAQLKRNLLAMGYTDDQAQEIATRLALMGGYA